jgi:hypothetical protein
MWPFSSQSSQYGTIAPEPKGLPDFRKFEKSDASIKIWLPQILIERVGWLSKANAVSRPDVIRALLFEHLYGRVAYDALQTYATQKRTDAALALSRQQLADSSRSPSIAAAFHGSDILKSTSRATRIDLEHIGKSVDDIEVKLPRQLKEDLEGVAWKHSLSASSYARKMLVLQLLGEIVHTTWQEAVGAISKDILVIEQD